MNREQTFDHDSLVIGRKMPNGTVELGYVTEESDVTIEGMQVVVPGPAKLVLVPCERVEPIAK